MLNKYLRKKSVKTIYILEQENNICMYVSRISASGLSDNLCPSLQSWLSQVCQVCLRFCLRSLSFLSFSILLFDTDGSLSYSRDLKYFVLFYWVVEIKVIFVLSCMMDCWKLVFLASSEAWDVIMCVLLFGTCLSKALNLHLPLSGQSEVSVLYSVLYFVGA